MPSLFLSKPENRKSDHKQNSSVSSVLMSILSEMETYLRQRDFSWVCTLRLTELTCNFGMKGEPGEINLMLLCFQPQHHY